MIDIEKALSTPIDLNDEVATAEKIVFIYGLRCPKTDQIRYVGKSINPRVRYSRHITEKSDYHRNRWINKLKSEGLKPELVVIDEVYDKNWKEAEINYIRLFKSFGADLVNKTSGGDSGPVCYKAKNANWGKVGKLNHRSKAVYVFDKIGNFIEEIGSLRQAQKKYNVDFSSIIKCCKGVLHNTGNYTFRYKEDFECIPDKININPRKYNYDNNNRVIPIELYDKQDNFIRNFRTITQASEITGMNISAIRKIINKQTKPRKYVFRYKQES